MNEITIKLQVDELIYQALKEDIPFDDVSTNAVVGVGDHGQVDLICKDVGILCGIDVFSRTFQLLDPRVQIELNYADGDDLRPGALLASLTGPSRSLLAGERTALNFLQRMSGVASLTRSLVEVLDDAPTKLLDTRKTSPQHRILEKYATRVGGAVNHRFSLSDGVVLKDNHIAAAGSIGDAIRKAREYAPFVRLVEVEVKTLDQVEEALAAGADIIMLDNMSRDMAKEAIDRIDGQATVQIAGNMDAEKIAAYRDLGADYISAGILTYSAPVLDLRLTHFRPFTPDVD